MSPAVILDVGQVLLRWEPEPVLRDLVGADGWEDFAREVDFAAWHGAQDAGRTEAEAVAEARARHPRWAPALAGFYPRWLETLPAPVEGMEELLAELEAAGARLYGITNFPAERWAETVAAHALLRRLRDVVVSGREGLVKPDPAIFRRALARFGVAPGEAVFVDDSGANVAAAAALGIDAIRFEGAAALRAELARRGLP